MTTASNEMSITVLLVLGINQFVPHMALYGTPSLST